MAKNIFLISGTRPEVIKMAPVYFALKNEIERHSFPWKLKWISTGQHREMVKPLYLHFQIEPDFDLEIMRQNQSLTSILTTTLLGLSDLALKHRPDLIVVQGDTTSAMAAGLFAFQEKIPLAHVEAGLRTFDLQSPFPEEFNRRVLSLTAHWNFSPTNTAKKHLMSEGIAESKIYVTGNTSIDALLWTAKNEDPTQFSAEFRNLVTKFKETPFALVTLHRRENWGDRIDSVLSVIEKLANEPDKKFLFPMHLNPAVRKPILEKLKEISNVILTEPLGYGEFCWAMKNAKLIITDSGGIQEEALSFCTPMIITRENTERPETLETGIATLCGTDPDCIYENFQKYWKATSKKQIENPFGDGKSSVKIAKTLIESLLEALP